MEKQFSESAVRGFKEYTQLADYYALALNGKPNTIILLLSKDRMQELFEKASDNFTEGKEIIIWKAPQIDHAGLSRINCTVSEKIRTTVPLSKARGTAFEQIVVDALNRTRFLGKTWMLNSTATEEGYIVDIVSTDGAITIECKSVRGQFKKY